VRKVTWASGNAAPNPAPHDTYLSFPANAWDVNRYIMKAQSVYCLIGEELEARGAYEKIKHISRNTPCNAYL
jgi:hypothetical protein